MTRSGMLGIIVFGLALMACGDDDERIVDARTPPPDAPLPVDSAPVIDAPVVDGAVSDAAVTDARVTDASTTFDFTFTGNNYAPHVGQSMGFALWDDADAVTPVVVEVITLAAATVDQTWTGVLVPGHSYTFYFFAGLDGNTTCDTGVDHYWMIASIGPVAGNESRSRNHDPGNLDGDCTKHPAP